MEDKKQVYVAVDKTKKLFYYDGEKYIPVLDEKGGDITLKTINGESLKGEGNIEVLTEYQPLKTINGEEVVGEGNINIQGGINSDNFINLTYNNSSEFHIEAADGRTFESIEDYADFLDPFDGKQFLVYVRPEASDSDKYNAEAAIILTDWDKGTCHISLETAHGIIDITITQKDVEVSDDYPTGIKLTYDIDWSKAVDWSSTSGGSGGDGDGKIGYVATFSFPSIGDPAPEASFWLTNAQAKELEELSGSTIQDIIDHWSSLNKSIIIPTLFNYSLQAKIWPDGADGDCYPCNITYAFDGEQDTELYFVYLDRGSQHQRIIIYGDDINNITLNVDEWTGGGSGGTVDTEKLISINMTNMDCTGIDDNGSESRIIRDLQLYCTKERWDNFVSLASSMMGVDVTYTNFDSVFKTLSVSQQATAIGYLLMDYYNGKILPEAYLQRNVNTQGFSGKSKYGIVDLTTLTDPQSGVEFVWDCQFRGSATSGDKDEVGTIPSPDVGETNYYTNDTVITVQEVEGAAIASSGETQPEIVEINLEQYFNSQDLVDMFTTFSAGQTAFKLLVATQNLPLLSNINQKVKLIAPNIANTNAFLLSPVVTNSTSIEFNTTKWTWITGAPGEYVAVVSNAITLWDNNLSLCVVRTDLPTEPK